MRKLQSNRKCRPFGESPLGDPFHNFAGEQPFLRITNILGSANSSAPPPPPPPPRDSGQTRRPEPSSAAPEALKPRRRCGAAGRARLPAAGLAAKKPVQIRLEFYLCSHPSFRNQKKHHMMRRDATKRGRPKGLELDALSFPWLGLLGVPELVSSRRANKPAT